MLYIVTGIFLGHRYDIDATCGTGGWGGMLSPLRVANMQTMQSAQRLGRVNIMHIMQCEPSGFEGKNPPQQLPRGGSSTPPRDASVMSNYPV